jgi:4-amino-4-deoxy-L-arabinose transferase-like glycosyltransferase
LLARQDRVVLALALAAIVLTLLYGAYLSPEWDPGRDDQVQYVALARGLVERGEYTRASPVEAFIPEPLRFPGYPLFLAPLCAADCSPWLITAVQALLLGGLVLLIARFAAPLVGARGARIAAALVALHPAFAFFAAHALSDLLATVLGVATVMTTASLTLRGRALAGVAPGALAAAATLTRPFLIFLLPLTALTTSWRRNGRGPVVALAVAAIVFVVAATPYVVYTERAFARPIAGSTGAQLWLAYFQGLDEGALDATERAQADAGRAALASFDAIPDRVAQAQAFIALDDELGSRALTLIAHDPLGFMARGIGRSVWLWAGDVPARPEDASVLVTAVWIVGNTALFGLGLVGAARLARRGPGLFAVPLLVIVATWVLSYPLWAEGRFALPARPFLAVGVAAFVEDLIRRRRV